MKSDPLITFRRRPTSLDIPKLESFAIQLQKRVLLGRPFHCLITGDTEMRGLNQQFLAHNYATDVLSFPASGAGDGGEIAISLARARAQAREWKHGIENEVCVLMLHGTLHLAGFDHETDDGAMARQETWWRARLGLSNGLLERNRKARTR